MVDWEPLIDAKGTKRKSFKLYDQRKRLREYVEGGNLHCSGKNRTVITLCYIIAGIILFMLLSMHHSKAQSEAIYLNQPEPTIGDLIGETTIEFTTTTTSKPKRVIKTDPDPTESTTTADANSVTKKVKEKITNVKISNAETPNAKIPNAKISDGKKIAKWVPKNKCNTKLPKHKGLDLCEAMPNPNFIFHNKLPKSGSTTFYQILVALAEQNEFDLIHLHPCFDPNDKMGFVDIETGMSFPEDFEKNPVFCKHSLQRNDDLALWLKKNVHKKRKTVLIKHHVYMEFDKYKMEQPTFINVARDPVSLFASKFYFERYSCNSCEEDRSHTPDDDKLEMTIEDCIKSQDEECYGGGVKQIFIEYLCGASVEGCKRGKNDEDIKALVDKIKHNVLREYYVIGILEEMDLSMKLMELMMPTFFTGIFDAYKGPVGQEWTNNSATSVHYNVSAESRKYLSTGPLTYSMDVYNFIKSIFWQRIKAYGLK